MVEISIIMTFSIILGYNKEINIFLLRTDLIKIDVKQVLITNFAEKGHVYNRKSTSFFLIVVKFMVSKSH